MKVVITSAMPPFLGTSCRDRTAEFFAITERLAKQVTSPPSYSR